MCVHINSKQWVIPSPQMPCNENNTNIRNYYMNLKTTIFQPDKNFVKII